MRIVNTYNVLKALHVLAAVTWVGGAITINILGSRIAATNDGAGLAAFARETAWVGNFVYLPASVMVLLFGVLAVLEGDWSFGDAWVSIGLLGVLVTALTGSLFFGPESKRIARLVESQGVEHPEVRDRTTRILRMGRVDLVVLLVVVVVMVLKPGT
ncbi:MAG: DUF2269 family protein [Actinomycetota bacterium]|nr:DUF2269 family protein [Actinomycetota bacterium]